MYRVNRRKIPNLDDVVCGRCLRWPFRELYLSWILKEDFSGGSDDKASVYNVRDLGLIPGLGRFPGERNGNPLQYSCLENSMDRGAWCRLLTMGSQRVGHDWATSLQYLIERVMVSALLNVLLKRNCYVEQLRAPHTCGSTSEFLPKSHFPLGCSQLMIKHTGSLVLVSFCQMWDSWNDQDLLKYSTLVCLRHS